MRLQKWFISLGMIGVLSFFTHTILGNILRQGYNPIQQSISGLTADGAPYASLLRIFVGVYEVCFLIFALSMFREALYRHHGFVKTGYVLLLFSSLFSIVNFNAFPMTYISIISVQNLAHVIITIALIGATILAVTLISIGYLKRENLKRLGGISLFVVILASLFNILLWYANLNGYDNFGLLERLTVYPFHVFTFVISWNYIKFPIAHLTKSRNLDVLDPRIQAH